MNPRISVLMSVHNGGEYLERAIKSILDQSYSDFEFIIIDDASTDSSIDIIKSFDDERIVLISNKTILGLTQSLNIGLEASKGEYIARMDADDVSHIDRLEKQLSFMELNKDIWVVGSNINVIGEKGDVKDTIIYPETHDEILGSIFFKNNIAHSTAFFRRAEVVQIGGYNHDYKKSQDYELWLQIILHGGRLHNLQEVLLDYRVHGSSISQSTETSSEQETYSLKALQVGFKQLMRIDVDLETLKIFRYIYFHNNSTIPMNRYLSLSRFLKSFKKYISAKQSQETIQAFDINYKIFMYNLSNGIISKALKIFTS